jgi:hypothetical protein
VGKSLGKIDIILQVIMSPESPAEAFVDHYLVLIPCQSFTDFQKMLDLKGVRRTEQNNLLDVFLARTSLLRDLSDTSVLSGIEMDNASSSSAPIVTGGSTLSGFGSLQGLMHSSPNSALANNLNHFIGSLPSLQAHSLGSGAGTPSRSQTPQLGQSTSDQGLGLSFAGRAGLASTLPDGKTFGFKKIGRLFTKDAGYSR